MNKAAAQQRVQIREVLAEGWRLTVAGLFSVFPWILAAEVIGALPVAGAGGGILGTDLGLLVQPAFLGWLLLSASAQAFCYGCAILKLARHEMPAWRTALRAIPALIVGWLIYELLVICGLGISVIFMLLIALLFGFIPAIVTILIPLAPTAWISTALSFFAYPAVLERRGPFAALGRSFHLARSNWAHAALVISVPAIGLLCVAVLQDVMPVRDALREFASHASGFGGQPTLAQLQNMFSSMNAQQALRAHPWWDVLTVVLSALMWWYTLAVCYVEYRVLNQPASVTER